MVKMAESKFGSIFWVRIDSKISKHSFKLNLETGFLASKFFPGLRHFFANMVKCDKVKKSFGRKFVLVGIY